MIYILIGIWLCSEASGTKTIKTQDASYTILSPESGFYDEELAINIRVEEGTTVYYTLDGSFPNWESDGACLKTDVDQTIVLSDASRLQNKLSARSDYSIAYADYMHYAGLDEPIFKVPNDPVDKCVVVNAVEVNRLGIITNQSIETYFIGFTNKSGYNNIKKVSLVIEPSDFCGFDDGINVLGRTFYEASHDEQYQKWGECMCFVMPTTVIKGKNGRERPIFFVR